MTALDFILDQINIIVYYVYCLPEKLVNRYAEAEQSILLQNCF